MQYPAKFAASDGGGYRVTFRDIPEAVAHGETMESARSMAAAALVDALDHYAADVRHMPEPSAPGPDEELVELPPMAVMRLQLLNAIVGTRASPGAQRAEALASGWHRAGPGSPDEQASVGDETQLSEQSGAPPAATHPRSPRNA